MKIAKKTVDKLFTKNGVPIKDTPKRTPPPLALVVETLTNLKINPKDSSKKAKDYKFTIYHIDGTESLRQTIQWYKDIQLVISGTDTTEAEQMIPLIEGRCEGSALAAFQDPLGKIQFEYLNQVDQRVEEEQGEQKAAETDEEYETRRTEARAQLEATVGKITKKDINFCLQQVIEAACPYKVLQKQKKYMRRYMRKPRDRSIRHFVNSVVRMNNNELPHLPPFEPNQKLPEDDVIEIVLHACPNSWIQEMDR
jgi:hypothetical protein